jgi:pimeloyl-ACP methyl ester carboxylesterase
MSELQLVKHEPTDYGMRHEGFVPVGNSKIDVTLRAPAKGDWSGVTYVLVNGWTASKNSMRTAAVEATRVGHKAVTFDYNNKRIGSALLSNAANCAAVIDSLRAARLAAISLSMGGPVLTAALMQARSRLEVATQVAPAHTITEEFSLMEAGKHLLAEGRELVGLSRHPLQAAHLAAGVMRNCAERPLAVVGEFGELISGTQHGNFESVTAGSDAPFMRLMYGIGDLLLPADPMVAGAGSLFDEVRSYDGGHVEFVKGTELAQNIFAWDAALMAPDMAPVFSRAA